MRAFLSRDPGVRVKSIADIAVLADFLDSRASFVAQNSLYGYLRTRAGMRYPVLFDNDEFIHSMNIAKWQVWAACLSDLSIYTGSIMAEDGVPPEDARRTLSAAVGIVGERTGTPADAGDQFPVAMDQLRARLENLSFPAPPDVDIFAGSQDALVYWAPIVDQVKALDEEIVRNSIRFRWLEIQAELKRLLRSRELAASLDHAG